MSIRQAYIIDDIQNTLVSFFRSLPAPFTSWLIVPEFPDRDKETRFDQAILYVEQPRLLTNEGHALGLIGHGYQMKEWFVPIGGWTDRQTGGHGELNIMLSNVINLFRNPTALKGKTFTATLQGVAYSGQTLKSMGLHIQNVFGPEDRKDHKAEDEFRSEVYLRVRSN